MADFPSGQMDHFARHGGVHFKNNASEQEINQFVAALPKEKQNSMFQVMKELEAAGLITVYNDGLLADGEGKIGGSDEC
jgi:hypothetical protein